MAIIPPVDASCEPAMPPNCDRVFALRVSFGVTSLPRPSGTLDRCVFTGVSLTLWSNRGGGAACLLRVLRESPPLVPVPFKVKRPGPARRMVDPGVPKTLDLDPGVIGDISPRFIGVAMPPKTVPTCWCVVALAGET